MGRAGGGRLGAPDGASGDQRRHTGVQLLESGLLGTQAFFVARSAYHLALTGVYFECDTHCHVYSLQMTLVSGDAIGIASFAIGFAAQYPSFQIMMPSF